MMQNDAPNTQPSQPTTLIVPPGVSRPAQDAPDPSPQPPPGPRDPTPTPPGWEPILIAALRGVLTALLSATTVFLATWSHTDDPKTLAIATATAFVTVLTARFGIEGALDQAKKYRAS